MLCACNTDYTKHRFNADVLAAWKTLGDDGLIRGDITDRTLAEHVLGLSPEQGLLLASHVYKTGVKAASWMSTVSGVMIA